MDKISGILSSRRTAAPVTDQNNIRPGAYNPFSNRKEEMSLAIAQDSYDKFFSPHYKSSSDAAQALKSEGLDSQLRRGESTDSDSHSTLPTDLSTSPSIHPADIDRTNSAPLAASRPSEDLDLNTADPEGFSYRDYPKGSFLNVAA